MVPFHKTYTEDGSFHHISNKWRTFIKTLGAQQDAQTQSNSITHWRCGTIGCSKVASSGEGKSQALSFQIWITLSAFSSLDKFLTKGLSQNLTEITLPPERSTSWTLVPIKLDTSNFRVLQYGIRLISLKKCSCISTTSNVFTSLMLDFK